MSDAVLEVLAPGAYASVQDVGRRGLRRIGVPWSGMLDTRLMRIANVLAGQPEGTPAIECFDGGLHVVARGGDVRVAVAGDADVELERSGERTALPAWRSVTLRDGDALRVRRLRVGRIAVLAVCGLAVPMVLDSASTCARAGFGGFEGRPLRAGDRLAATAPEGPELALPRPPPPDTGPLRVVPGPQADRFTEDAMDVLLSSDYRVTAEADRMGVRLQGPPLRHAATADIVSDATVPGSIQVPGNGQPIVLLADAQTAGGYAKIATVASADLPRVAQSRPGAVLRFERIDTATGERLARDAEAATRALLHAVRPLAADGLDAQALYTENLISGTVHVLSPEWRPLPGTGQGEAS